MPIQFPAVAGPKNNFAEKLWLAQMTKCFDAVPAPNMGRPGAPVNTTWPGGMGGWSLNPGYTPQAAVNLRRPSTTYQAPDQTAVVNPAAMIDECYDETKGFDRDLGQLSMRIIGVSRDASGAALGGCSIHVFRTTDDTLVALTTSDGSGNWVAYPNAPGPYYFVEYKAGSPDVFGTSPNTNTATPFQPGQ